MSDGQSPQNADGSVQNAGGLIEGLLGAGDNVGDGTPSRYAEEQGGQARGPNGRYVRNDADPTDDDDDDDALAAQAEDDTGDGDTDDAAAASADDDANESDDENSDPLETLAQFAEAMEVSVEDLLGNVRHSFRASGEEVEVTLDELVRGYQKDADYRRNTQRLAEERRTQEQGFVQRAQQFEEANHVLAHQLNVATHMLTQEANSPAMMALRQSDPQEWNARQTEFAQRLQGVQQAREQAAAAYQQHRQKMSQQILANESQALMRAMPDFDANVHTAQARDAIVSLGFSPEEANQVTDHRFVLGALELHRLRAELGQLRDKAAKAEAAVKRVKKDVKPMQKPGKRRAQGNKTSQRNRIAKLQARAKKSGTLQDAAAVIEQGL